MKWLDWIKKEETPAVRDSSLNDLLRQLARTQNTRSGVTVTPESAMALPAINAAVTVISEAVAQLPVAIYERLPDGGKERRDDHPLHDILHFQPNEYQDTFQWREMATLHTLLWGDHVSFRNVASGQIRELLPIHPSRVDIEQDDDYSVTYKVRTPAGEEIILGPSQVFHLRDRSLCGAEGMSRIGHSRESVGIGIQTERHAGLLYGNGAQPSGILSTEQPLKKEQIDQLRESWKAAHSGDNAFSTAVLDAGMKWQQLSMSAIDSQFLETRKFQISEASRIFRVPPHMLGDLERATHSNIEQQSLEFVIYCLTPWLRRWECAINKQLIRQERRGKFFAEFNVDGLLRGDIKTRYEAYQIGLQNGWLNPNEVRSRENMNPREGGDEYHQAANLFGEPEQPEEEPEDDQIAEAVAALIRSRTA